MDARNILFGILLLSTLLICGTNNNNDIIYWTEDYKLDWDDFKASPRSDYQNLAALTSSGIAYYTGCEEGMLTYMIKSYFDKNESWVKPTAKNSHTLEHEQIHFDITELFARKLRKSLKQRSFKCYEDLEFKQFVDVFLTNWEVEQRLYDIHSSFSVNKKEQKVWLYKITSELHEHKAYKQHRH